MSIRSEFLTSNVHTAFPFKENAVGIVYPPIDYQHGASATLPADFMVDALLSVPDGVTSVVLYSIERLTSSSWQFKFADDTGTVIFTYDITSVPDFQYNEFATIKMYDESLRWCLIFTVMNMWNTYLEEIPVGNTDSFGVTIPFESSVINTLNPRLTAVTIGEVLTEYAGKLKLIGGYNLEILETTDIDDSTILTLNISPGLGLGLAPCEEITTPRLMELIPDSDGNIEIKDANGCYNIVPHQLTQTVEIQGDCYQCCNCSQYVNVGLAIKKLVDRAMASKTSLTEFQTKLNDAIANYNIKIDNCVQLANFYASGRKYPDDKSGLIIVGFVNSSAVYDLTINSVGITSPALVTNVSPPGDSLPFTVPKAQTSVVMYSLTSAAAIPGAWSVTVAVSAVINTETKTWNSTFTLDN
ncbi:hypothetical protein ACFLQL_00290 [Verrucomicrobiota bacterium]